MSETSFKFFIQFVFYTATFCTFAVIVSAYFTAEVKRNVSDLPMNHPFSKLTSNFLKRLAVSMRIGAFALDCE